MNFPIIADKDRRVSMLFGMLDPTTFRHGSNLGQTMTVRSVFIIAPSKRIELMISYPAYIGRSFNEILRVSDLDGVTLLQALQPGDPFFCAGVRGKEVMQPRSGERINEPYRCRP